MLSPFARARHSSAIPVSAESEASCLSGDLQAIRFSRPVFHPPKTEFTGDSNRLAKMIFVPEQAPVRLFACKFPVSRAGGETKG